MSKSVRFPKPRAILAVSETEGTPPFFPLYWPLFHSSVALDDSLGPVRPVGGALWESVVTASGPVAPPPDFHPPHCLHQRPHHPRPPSSVAVFSFMLRKSRHHRYVGCPSTWTSSFLFLRVSHSLIDSYATSKRVSRPITYSAARWWIWLYFLLAIFFFREGLVRGAVFDGEVLTVVVVVKKGRAVVFYARMRHLESGYSVVC
jgi:hypothetical protein